MNPLTLVKRTQKITAREAELGISEDASWHAKYKQSAYVFVGGIPFDLTEGDLLAVFAQYGEIVDVNLIRDKGTGKSRGFAFVAYEDQRSTNLAVDNLNGASVLGRIIRVDHAANYKKKEEEDEEEAQKKREARGVCRAFQKGECNRGAACRFSHNEQRCANTGWGAKDSDSKWDHDKHDKFSKSYKTSGNVSDIADSPHREKVPRFRSDDKDKRMSRLEDNEGGSKRSPKRNDINAREHNRESMGKHSERSERGHNFKDRDRRDEKRPEQDKTRSIPEDRKWSTNERSIIHRLEQNRTEDRHRREERSGRRDVESNPRKDQRREEWSGRYDMEGNPQDDHGQRGGEKQSRHDRHSSTHHNREGDEVHDRRSRK